MKAVEVRRGRIRDEELAAVGIWPPVGHGQQTWPVKLEVRVELVFERVTWPSSPCPRWIASLGHETGQDTVKRRVVIVALSGQKHEIVDRHRSFLREEPHPEIADLGLEESLVGFRGINFHRWRRGPLKRCSTLFGFRS